MNSVLEERTIHIRDLFAALIEKAWLMLIAGIVFAVLFSGYKYMGNKNELNVTNELSDEEKEQVDSYIEQKTKKEELEAYANESEFMQLNPYSMYQETIVYHVSGQDGQISGSDTVRIIEDWINGGGISGIDNELVSCNKSEDADSVSVSTEASNVITVKVLASDEEDVKDYSDTVISQISEFVNQNTLPEIRKISETAVKVSRADIVDKQQQINKYLSEAVDNLSTQYDALNDMQKMIIDDGDISTIANKESKVHIAFKYSIIAFVAGVVLMMLFIIINFIVKGALVINDDIWESLGLTRFGRIVGKEKKSWLRKVALKVRGIDDNINFDVMVSKINKKINADDVVVLSGANKDNIIGELVERLKEKNINVVCSENEVDDVKLQDKISNSYKILLLEYPYVDKAENVLRSINDRYDSIDNILGYVEIVM